VAAYRRAFGAARPIDAGELLSWLRNPEVDPHAQTRVLEVDGAVVGYGDVSLGGEDVALEVAAPGYWARFLEWAEDTARMRGARRARVIDYARGDLADAASARGYVLWRSNYTMRVEFREPPALSRPPDRIGLRTYREEDAERVRLALNEIFAPDPFFHELSPDRFRAFHRGARGFDPSLWLLAWDESELAGLVLAFPERTGDTTVGRIESLGVRPGRRGRGLGEFLLRSALRALHDRGLRSVELGVDASNETGAVRLYERAGMSVLRQADNWALNIDPS
jgi:mycothiol synthase